MQPLDVAFMKPFKSYYSLEIHTFLRNVSHEDRARKKDLVTPIRVAKLFGAAYRKAATMEISMNGFRKEGLYPLNRKAFRDCDFLVMDNEKSVDAHPASPALLTPVADIIPTAPSQDTCESIPGPSGIVSPHDIIPLPRFSDGKTNRRARGTACVLNSPEQMKKLRESLEKGKSDKSRKKRKKTSTNSGKGNGSGRQKQKKIQTSSSSESDVEKDPSLHDSSEETVIDHDIDDTECLFCGQNYKDDTNGEQWVQCIICCHWVIRNAGHLVPSLGAPLAEEGESRLKTSCNKMNRYYKCNN